MREKGPRLVVSSMELARVKEIPQRRRFEVTNADGKESTVFYNPSSDTLFCHRHGVHDNCTCTARVRLCGCLTNSVTPDVLNRAQV